MSYAFEFMKQNISKDAEVSQQIWLLSKERTIYRQT